MPPSQTAPALPQGLSEEALKEALQVPSIWVESQDVQDPKCQEIEREVALLSPFIQKEVLRCGHGLAQTDPVVLPKQVNCDVLNLLLDYCRFHRAPGRSDKERKLFDEKFIRLDTRRLCELTSAADALDMKPLVDLTSRALARMIEGKSAEEIRETFHLPDDLTEEEKLEPVKNATADPRIRLLNRLYAKKRKELAHKKAEEVAAEARAREVGQAPSDERPLEDLLSFIGTAPPGGKSKAKQKKKRSRKRNGMVPAASIDSEASQTLAAPSIPGPSLAGSSECQGLQHSTNQNHADSAPDTSPTGVGATSKACSADIADAVPSRLSDSVSSHQQPQQAKLSQPTGSGAACKHRPAMAAPDTQGEWAADEGQPNGCVAISSLPSPAWQAASVEDSASITDEDDAALLADMHGFASALGCDWQVQGPGMVSLGTLPLPGAHITTLTSLANFRPSNADSSQAHQHHSDCGGSSQSARGESHESELDTDDELEAAFDDRQAANLREANVAYDVAMSRVAAEDSKASFRPHWPDDPSHASHASFGDWATNASHANGSASPLTSHGSFSFANGCPELPSHSEQHTSTPWPGSHQEVPIQESIRCSIDVQAVQGMFREFLQKAGLDSHLEVRSVSGGASGPHCQRNVTVQNVFPCGTFMKIQLN